MRRTSEDLGRNPRGRVSQDDGGTRQLRLSDDNGSQQLPGDEFAEHGHTLSAMQGKGLRRELVYRSLHASAFEGDNEGGLASPAASTTPADTPQHTLTGAEAGHLVEAKSMLYGHDSRVSLPQSSKHARLDGLFSAIKEAGSNSSLDSMTVVDETLPAGEDAAARTAGIGGTGGAGPVGAFGTICETEVAVEVTAEETEGLAAHLALTTVQAPEKQRTFMVRSASKHRALSELVELVDADLVGRCKTDSIRGGIQPRARHVSINLGSLGLGNQTRAVSVIGAKDGEKAGGSNTDNGDAVDRRRALRSVARDVENLMLISEALTAKEMPGLANRLKEGLSRIQNNVRVGYKNEGLVAQKRSAMRRVNRLQIIREAASDVVTRRPSWSLGQQKGMGAGGDGHPAGVAGEQEGKEEGKGDGGDKPVSFKVHCLRACMVGVVLLILCSIPHILHQYEPDTFLEASSVTVGGFNAGGINGTGVLPLSVPLPHSSRGLYEVTMGAGRCMAAAPAFLAAASSSLTGKLHYYAAVKLVQNGNVLGSGDLKLHDLGSAGVGGGGRQGRHLLSGGGNDGPPGADVYNTFYFDIANGGEYDGNGGSFSLEVQSDCPRPVGLSLKVLNIGPVGSSQQWVALALLIIVFALIITEVVHRTLIAFMGAAAVLFILALEHRLPNVYTIMGWMDHGTLALLWGMMIIVSLLARTGVFEFVSVRLIEASGMDMWRLTWMLMLFDCVLSAFLDNVSTMLLLGPVIISLCRAIGQDPRPMLIPMALFGNIGGTSTMIGDPPNLIIGNALKDEIGFVDFLRVLAPGVILTLFPALAFLRWYYGAALYSKNISVDIQELKERYPIRDFALLARSGIVLGFVLILFFLHPVIHFEPAYAALFGAIAILLMGPAADFEHALEKVEWDSLLFFAGLFVFTEGIAELGLLRLIADQLSLVIESVPIAQRSLVSGVLIQVVAAVASAFVDNIPFTTTMIPVIKRMAANVEGLEIQPLAWALCFGADYGGMGTLIGSSANVVMAGVAAEAGYPISFMSFFRIGWPMMCICVCVSVGYLSLMIHIGYV